MNLIKGELDYLFDDWFNFDNTLNTLFSGSGGGNGGGGSFSISAIYAIRDYQNTLNKSSFKVIRDYQNTLNSAFYKMGLNVKIPPVTITFKNFED